MLSIGHIAHGAGVSRRMLRHWEQEGLLQPATVGPATGYRYYQDTQLGRVHAIAELRQLGFGLAEIKLLLDPRVEQSTLEAVLAAQASTLQRQITVASARLVRVQQRLDAIHQHAQEIPMRLTLRPLPALSMAGFTATVLDETEIPDVASALRAKLPDSAGAVTCLYDGTRDDLITVSVGSDQPLEATETLGQTITVSAVDKGASVHFDALPESVADAWVLIDAELAKQGLTTFGVYRHRNELDGGVWLEAPVRELS